MENTLLSLLASFMVSIATIYTWTKCLNCNFKISKILITTFLIFLITVFLNFFMPNPLRLILVFLFLIIICYFSFTNDFKKAIYLVIISESILGMAEFSYIIILSVLSNELLQNVMENNTIYIVLNIYIIIFSYMVNKIKFAHNVYKYFNSTFTTIKSNETLTYSVLIISIIVVTTMETYMELPLTIILITNVVMAILFIRIVMKSTKIQANYNKISSKYETSVSSLKEYEVMIDKFRVETHENKNEFLTVRNMIKDNPDEAIKYIDKLVDNKIEDNNKIMKKTAKIPSGGLKATIYSKLCLMDKLKIKYKLNIARDVHTTDLINLDEDLVLKICKILGVFLDNAIEAVKKLKKKEIFVEIYSMDSNLCIDITNNFKGNLDLNKISEQKYTTKGDGHGYGLSLVDELLKEEPERLENEKSINGDTFTQMLKIKM